MAGIRFKRGTVAVLRRTTKAPTKDAPSGNQANWVEKNCLQPFRQWKSDVFFHAIQHAHAFRAQGFERINNFLHQDFRR